MRLLLVACVLWLTASSAVASPIGIPAFGGSEDVFDFSVGILGSRRSVLSAPFGITYTDRSFSGIEIGDFNDAFFGNVASSGAPMLHDYNTDTDLLISFRRRPSRKVGIFVASLPSAVVRVTGYADPDGTGGVVGFEDFAIGGIRAYFIGIEFDATVESISIEELTTNGSGMLFDDLRLALPEPSSALLLGLGLVWLRARSRAFRGSALTV